MNASDVHNPRNHRTTNRAFIFRHLGITRRTTNRVFTRRKPRIDAELETQNTLMFFVIGFFGRGEMRS